MKRPTGPRLWSKRVDVSVFPVVFATQTQLIWTWSTWVSTEQSVCVWLSWSWISGPNKEINREINTGCEHSRDHQGAGWRNGTTCPPPRVGPSGGGGELEVVLAWGCGPGHMARAWALAAAACARCTAPWLLSFLISWLFSNKPSWPPPPSANSRSPALNRTMVNYWGSLPTPHHTDSVLSLPVSASTPDTSWTRWHFSHNKVKSGGNKNHVKTCRLYDWDT